MLRRVPIHSRCGLIASGRRSGKCGEPAFCSSFSRCNDSSSGPFVSTTSKSKRPPRAAAVRTPPRRLTPRNAGFLVFFPRSPARPRRAEDLASIVLDQDAAGLRQEFSLGRRSEGNEEIGIVLGTLEKGAARDAHRDR